MTERQVEMSEYQLGLIAPQRIEAFRLEGETYRRMQASRQPHRSGQVDAIRFIAILRLCVSRFVPAS
jgi:hypothetical protein